MADKKISGLPAASGASAADELETNQSGTSRRLSLAQVLAYIQGAIAVPWTQVTGKPATFTPSAHTHAQSEVTGLASALAAKAAASDLTALAARVTTLESSGGLTAIDGGTP